ncbi:MAG: DUF92 domain-containing protein [bacterium]
MSRPALHVAAGLPAIALRFLSPGVAIGFAAVLVAHNVFLLPRYAPAVMRQGARADGRADAGVALYPLVVLALLLLFRERLHLAAAAWAILAFGDGAAAVAGRALGGPRLPWNAEKRWAGSAAFVLVGTPAAAAIGCFVSRAASPPAWPGFLSALLPVGLAALLAAAAETLPWRLDDNARIGLASAAALAAAASVDPGRVSAALAAAAARLPLAALVSGAAGLAALVLGAVDVSGFAAGTVLGILLWSFAGVGAFASLAVFVGVATAATRLGRGRKERLRVAQASGGRRGAPHALANVGLAAALAPLSLLASSGGVLRLALAAALATAAFDTTATEIGQATSQWAWQPRTWRRVPAGTPGAVSAAGTVAGVVAAALVALAAMATGLVSPRAPGILVVSAGVGALTESFLASSSTARELLDGHGWNALNTSVGASVAALLAHVW